MVSASEQPDEVQAADADITTNAMPTNAFEATPPFCRPAADEFDRISMRRMSGGAASPFRMADRYGARIGSSPRKFIAMPRSNEPGITP
jgi:hypothetical protein